MATKKQQAELNKLVKEWTNILRLNSWDIFAEFGHPEDFATNINEDTVEDIATNAIKNTPLSEYLSDEDTKELVKHLDEWYPDENLPKAKENEEFIGNISAGEIQVDFTSGTVLILILDPKDYKEQDFFIEQDIEETLVHELLHLYFYDIDGLSPHNISQIYIEEISRTEGDKNINRPEKLINDMAKILVRLKRSSKK